MPSPTDLQADLQRAIALLEAGQFEKAIASVRRLLKAAPDAPLLHLILGMSMAGAGQMDPAIHHYGKALKLKPNWFEAHNNLGVVLQKQGRLQEAADQFLAAQKINPASTETLANLRSVLPPLSAALFVQNKPEEAEHLLRLLLSLSPDSTDAALFLGIMLVKRGMFDDALPLLSQASAQPALRPRALAFQAITQRACGNPTADTLSAILQTPASSWNDTSLAMWAALGLGKPEEAFSLRTDRLNILNFSDLAALEQRDLQSDIAALPTITGTLPRANARPLLYAAADGLYAARFAKTLIASVLSQCPACDFHLHIMNPGSFDPEQTFRDLPRERISWTTEEFDAADITIFSTRRFVRLAQIMMPLARTVVALDVDIVVNRDLMAALPAQFDVLLYERPNEPYAHTMVNAGLLGFSPRGREFLNFLARYILHFDALGESRWYVDQMGIVAARAWFCRHKPDVVIQAAGEDVMGWNTARAQDYVLWHQKGEK